MQRSHAIYVGYVFVMLLLNVSIWATPILAFQGNATADTLYNNVFVYFCHQKISRSLCLFEGPNGYFVADCLPQQGEYTPNDSRLIRIVQEGIVGYKLPVCARDIAIYGAMLLLALAYPLKHRLENAELPDPLYLVIALIPIAADGGLQLLSEFGLALPGIGLYESTNFNRLVTGFIAGAVFPFYLFPLLNRWLGGEKSGQPLKIKKREK